MYVLRNCLRFASYANVQVATTVAEMSSDAAAKLWDDTINRQLFDLIHSPSTVEKLGGLLAIG
jgi:FKBP12-rapamycin complex-associated protein